MTHAAVALLPTWGSVGALWQNLRAMQRQHVSSSMIRSIGYASASQTLEIEFSSGRIYEYFDVPEFFFRGLLATTSKGSYFLSRIDGRFKFRDVTSER